jgi:LuxR family transcriptional regulator, maltose regulon positive regulatory protein
VETALLTTKLYFPTARPSLVARPRLVERLQAGLYGQLTLISAPAGSGKTSLMSEWRSGAGSKMSVAWLSLDAEDNDLSRFSIYLVTALGSLGSGIGQTVLASLQGSQPPSYQAILTSLINELSLRSEPSALVLDDYHVITSALVHRSVNFLLDHLPLQLHLVIITRADPPLPLARLRARNQVTELRASDLRFTPEEAGIFLNTAMGLELSIEEIAALEDRTEGWIAGLQLAALSMQGSKDVKGFVSAFTGSNHYIFDYLAGEVLNRQPDSERKFLLQTSILERMTAPLCDAITNEGNGQEILEKLERENLFVIPLDDERRWYRYHHLFASMLRAQLGRQNLAIIPSLQQRACEWCAGQNLIEEAIFYAMASHDYSRAADLLESNSWIMLNQGKVFSVLKWITALPAELVTARPKLEVVQCWALFISGKEDLMATHLHKIEARTSQPESGDEILLLALGARWRGNAQESLKLTERALARLPENQSILHGQAWFNRGMVYRETNTIKAQQAFGQSSSISETRKDIQGTLKAMYFEGTMFRLGGALHRSEAVFKRTLELAYETPFFNGGGYAHLGMAEITYEWNDLTETFRHLSAAMRLAEEGELDELHFHASLASARLYRARGEWPQAQEMLDQAEQLASQAIQSAQMRVHTYLTIPVLQEQTCLWMARGKGELALANLELTSATEGIPLLYRQAKQTTLGRILIFQHKYEEALVILDQALDESEKAHLAGVSIKLLRADALIKSGKTELALLELERTLSLAELEGYTRVFLDEGEPVRNLLRHAASKGIHTACVRRLFTAENPAEPGINSEQTLIEPLSERELEILQLVASGKSNQQIAEQLFLAVGTVKRHLSNIFGKLNVQSRTECLARLRELDLLK